MNIFPRLSIGGLCLLAGCTNVVDGIDLESLVARHVEARGGQAAIEAVGSFDTNVRIVEPAFTVDGRYVATRDGRMRIDISVDGERVFTEALDHGSAWSWSPDAGVRAASAQAEAALRRGIESPFKLFGLHEMQRRGHRLELSGREVVDGVNYHVLQLTSDDGFKSRYYVNPDSWLIERDRQLRALHVDVNPEPEWIVTVTVGAIGLNRPVSDDHFHAP